MAIVGWDALGNFIFDDEPQGAAKPAAKPAARSNASIGMPSGGGGMPYIDPSSYFPNALNQAFAAANQQQQGSSYASAMRQNALSQMMGQLLGGSLDLANLNAQKGISALDAQSRLDVALAGGDAGRDVARIGADADRYVSDNSVKAQLGVADKYSGATKYTADQGLAGTKYTADKSLAGTQYSADKDLAGRQYTAQAGRDASIYGGLFPAQASMYDTRVNADLASYLDNRRDNRLSSVLNYIGQQNTALPPIQFSGFNTRGGGPSLSVHRYT